MTSFLLAALWTSLVLVVLIPLSTVLAKTLLMVRRGSAESTEGAASAFMLIVLPVLAPIVWFVSETVHESEKYLSEVVHAEGFCVDLVAASALLLGALAWLLLRYGRAERARTGRAHPETTARLRALCESHAVLSRWAGRVHGIADAEHDSAARGFFRPVAEVDAAFATGLGDAALVGVLLHEVEHLRTLDPLRNLIAQACLAMNPLGFWLVPDLLRWRAGRELQCDTAALSANADPLSLAEALILAARPRKAAIVAAPFTGAAAGLLKLRVQRLLEPVVERPEPISVRVLPPMLFVLEMVLPHVVSSAPIQQMHHVAFHPLLAALLV